MPLLAGSSFLRGQHHTFRQSISATLQLASHTQRRLGHALDATLTLSGQIRHRFRETVHATLSLTSTRASSVAHRAHSTLVLASRRASQIGHTLSATLTPTAIAHSLVRTLTRARLVLAGRVRGATSAFAPAIKAALTVLARTLTLTPAARTTTLAAAWKEDAMLATPVRATDAPPYISPDETNVAYSVDLTDALGALSVSTATLLHATARYPDQSDGQAIALPTFVNEIVRNSGTSITVVCGDGTQTEGQTIEIAIALHLATTPAAVWEVYLELPVKKGASD